MPDELMGKSNDIAAGLYHLYSLVEEILGSEYRVRHSRERHIVYFSKLGHYYKAVFKVTENKKEIFLVSLSLVALLWL